MDDTIQAGAPQSSQQRYKGYDRIMGNISWLLIALVVLFLKLMPADDSSIGYLISFSVLLLLYNLNARYGVMSLTYSPFKIFLDLMVFLAFIVAVCWNTGKISSPFISMIYLILMATALTQGRRVTYFMSGLAITSYILLGLVDSHELNYFLHNILEIFPFILIAHLGAILAEESETARSEIERLSLIDYVTGINNMRNFYQLADAQEKLAKRHKRAFTICMLDADGLKMVNDKYGHSAGTMLIKQVARIITDNIRSSDISARYGGDEFVIMFNETAKQEVINSVELIVRSMAATPIVFEGESFTTTLSAGLAGYPEDGEDVRAVMANADEAMYVSKRSGKNRVTVFSKTLYGESFGKREEKEPDR
jgi:diguanylate cyclase (GGDEF)-like protein